MFPKIVKCPNNFGQDCTCVVWDGHSYHGKTKIAGDRNNRQTSYSFVIAELKIDGQSTEQWNKCHSSVIFGCGDVPVL